MRGGFSALVAVVFILLVGTGAVRADLPGERVPWQGLGALAPADRALARAWANDSFPPPEPGGVDWRERARAAVVKLPDGGDLLFVSLPQLGNCGAIELRVYGPRARGTRALVHESPCMSGFKIAWRPGQRLPDLIEGVSDLVAVVHRADGDGWGETETIENLVPRRGPNQTSFARGPLSHLIRHAGSYDAPSVLRDPAVGPRLRKMLGPHYVKLLANLGTRGPIDMAIGCLIIAGHDRDAPNGGEAGMLAVCASGALHAVLLTKEGLESHLFSRATNWFELPEPIRGFFQRGEALHALPDGVNWWRAPEWLGD